MSEQPEEPDNPAAYALARHIADHPVGTIQAAFRYLNAPVTIELYDADEGAELTCVDQCGSCDACGMEPFATPAEGWREAAQFLRRTPHSSVDFPGALRGARLIEDELRRRAEETNAPDEQERHA